MFKLRRHKSSASDNSGEKFGFIFSNIQASQVPKGWDKLSLSLISVDTGRTISKLEKASVNNGTCQWTKSLWSPKTNASKDLDHFKFLVSMGTSKFGVLGEATVNVRHYRNSEASIPVSLPLKKCNKGTVLKFEIKCLTPRTNFSSDKWNSTAAYTEEGNSACNGMGNKSQEMNHSLPSMEDSLGRDSLSSAINSSGVVNSATGRLESTESGGSAPWSSYSYGSPKSKNSPNKLYTSSHGEHPQYSAGEIGHRSLHITRTSLQDAASSTNFPQAEDVNIEELKAEARMWELNARRLMINMETLKKEFTDQSQHIADAEMELSTSRKESNRLIQEIKHLEVLLEESNAKQIAAESLNLQAKNTDNILRELEDELRFQKESNNNLSLQLMKAQESNVELVSVLQEMEETFQKQKMEIKNLLALNSKFDVMRDMMNGRGDEDNAQPKSTEQVSVDKQCQDFELQHLQESQMSLENTIIRLEKALEEKIHEIELERDLRSQDVLNCEEKWKSKTISLEKDIANLQLMLSKSSSAVKYEANETGSKSNMDLIKEIESLKKTIQELERDCIELTEGNLELLFKLKESRRDPSDNRDMLSSKSLEGPRSESPTASEFETSKHGSQLLLLEEEMVVEGEAADSLQIQNSDLKENHSHLEPHFQAFKCKACDLNVELHTCCTKVTDKQGTDVTVHPSESQRDEIDSSNFTLNDVGEGIRYSEPETTVDIDSLLPAFCKQRELFLHNMNGVDYMLFSPVNIEFRNVTSYKSVSKCTDPVAQKEQAKAVFDKLVQLQRARLISCIHDDKYNEDGARTEVNNTYEIKDKSNYGSSTEKAPCSCHQGYKNFNEELEVKDESIGNNVLTKSSKILEVKTGCLEEDLDIKALNDCQIDLETKIKDRQMLAWKVENNMKKVQIEKEGDVTSESMREDMMVLTGSICAHISDKIQEMKLLELENEKQDLESSVCELEKENVQLSERVSGLEAQLRHLTDAMELSRTELQYKGTQLSNLQDKIGELEKEKESQKHEMKQRLMEMQTRWLEAQEESEYLKKANPKLQATAESLIEECDSLQILNGELRRQRLEFKVQCNFLEAELRKYQHSFSNCLNRIESLEAKLSSILEEASSKEKILNSKIEAILLQNKEYKERLVFEESLQSQLCQQKPTELGNLQQEAPLVSQIYDPCDGEDTNASEGFPEMHSLIAENKRLKLTLQEIQQNLEISEVKHVTTQMECERKVQDLMSEIDAHKTNQEVLAAKSDKLQRWSENLISSEANLKCRIDNLESKLLLSETERLQLADANSSLKIQLLKIAFLQDEVLALKGSLTDTKFKNERLESSLQLICGDNVELKAEKTSLIQELTGMQKSVAELEECRYKKIVLEEKVLRLEGDLTAREVVCAKDAELKNELGQSRRANSQLCWKIKQLELERYYLLKKVQSLQEELKRKENCVCLPSHSVAKDKTAACKELKLSEVGYSQCNDYETIQIPAIDGASKSQLGDEKSQFKSLPPEGQSSKPKMLEANEYSNEHERKISQLEAELKEISERYLHMSLKYAEVENQKGKLLMTLKALQDQRTRTLS